MNPWLSVAIYTAFFMVLIYLFVILPRKSQDKKHNAMVSSLERGEKIVTIGGIYGEISKIKENSVMLKVANGVELEISKRAIAYRTDDE